MSDDNPSRQGGAIVLGGNLRALGVVRSLGRRGIPVWVLTDEHRLAAHSRYCRRGIRWPSISDDRRVEFLLRLAERHQLYGWVLFPTTDFTAALIARHHSALSSRFLLTTPPWDEYRELSDKRSIHFLATKLGIDQPRTFFPGSREEALALACRLPVVLKPTIKEGDPNAITYAKALPARSPEELAQAYDRMSALVDPRLIMVQEWLPGGAGSEFSFAALCKDGEPLAYLAARRPRQHPLEFTRGATLVETIVLPEVEVPARKLLAALRFTGIVETSFMRDPEDGRYKLMDVNPRAWNWHSIGHRTGTDFAYLLWRMVRGEPVEGGRARTGVKWLRLAFDVPTAIRMYRRGLLTPRQYLDSLRGPREFAIFSMDDPLPALLDPLLLLWLARERATAREMRHRGAPGREAVRRQP